ncbi:MAG: hypothetical protein IJO52_11765, partial [Clostridia bacterium]|nr:hypothetical protein [Clostridia bacterium]
NAKNIEKSFELAESFWRIMDIEEFFRENVFMVYLKENATKEETQNVLDATIKRYGDRDMSDEYGIDYRFEIVAAFMQSYVTRGLKHLSYEQCFELIKHLNPYPNNDYPRYWILAAKIMCGDDEAIERELYELMSKEETVKKSIEDAKAAFYTIDSALSRYSGIHALDRYAEDIFFYLDELKELSREKPDYANAFYTAHLYSKEWFKSFEYSEKARKKCEEYKLYAQSLGLKLSEE